MKILLDENFPLPLYRRLREKGYDAEHVIVLGQRGMPDALEAFLQRKPQGRLFDLMPDGEIVAWEIRPLRKGS